MKSVETHAVEDVHPAFHGDALEDSEDGKKDVIKVSDAKVGSGPVLSALRSIGTDSGWWFLTTRPVCCLLPWQTNTERQGVRWWPGMVFNLISVFLLSMSRFIQQYLNTRCT